MLKDKKKTSHIFRAFLSSIYEQDFLGNNNADTLLDAEKLPLNSFKGMILNN